VIKEYLTQLSQELKLKPTTVKTKEVGVFEFEVDPLTKVELAEYELGITLKTELCETPTQDTGELYAKMMDANVFGIGTFGSVLGMSEDNKFLLLTKYIDYQPTYQEFRDTFEDYVNAVKFWQEKAEPYQGPPS